MSDASLQRGVSVRKQFLQCFNSAQNTVEARWKITSQKLTPSELGRWIFNYDYTNTNTKLPTTCDGAAATRHAGAVPLATVSK
jgi:hypothetical protein